MAVHVYAVTLRDHPCRVEDLTGVGGDGTPVRVLAAGGLKAVVSDCAEDLRPKRRDVAAHQAVLERLMADGTPLPVRFGYTAAGDDSVREVVTAQADVHLAALARVRDCAEYNVKAWREQDLLLREILDESPRARRLNREILAGASDPRLPLELGQLVAAEVQFRHTRASGELIQALVPLARAHVVHPPVGEDFLNLSLLVPRDDGGPLLAEHARLARDGGAGVHTRVAGPLPPYSFVP
ncbi:GvpL/GvpF family gas vesicle protein [Streptomyces bambusae]|uniref:GvpL/GvpF family gas vesicle protein n=1 Tax=Streptomyces bambusae TaxID=1550616 RepID=UPI001CFDBCFE|nr:GvpL/GvpF family gas vesicle protein [Streptomyces bambusae]MCB5164267.1 GvpL/GvpF family gas vesicle protein [Streptomyces bambusae]